MKIPEKNQLKPPGPIALQPSRYLAGVVVLMHLLAATAVVLANLPVWCASIGLLALLAHGLYDHHRRQSIPHYRLHSGTHEWQLLAVDNPNLNLIIERCYDRSHWLIVFRVKDTKNTARYFPVLSDCCERDAYHFLNILSRFGLR